MSRPRLHGIERQAAHMVASLPNETRHTFMVTVAADLLTTLGHEMVA